MKNISFHQGSLLYPGFSFLATGLGSIMLVYDDFWDKITVL